MPPDTMKREPGIVSTGHDEIDSKFTRPALRTSVAILFAVKKKAMEGRGCKLDFGPTSPRSIAG
jgi:hypothetical protein